MPKYKVIFCADALTPEDIALIKAHHTAYKRLYDKLESDILLSILNNKEFFPVRNSRGEIIEGYFYKTKYETEASLRTIFKIDHKNKIVEITKILVMPRD